MRGFNVLSAVFLAISLVACTSSGEMQLKQAKTEQIQSGKTVALNVALAPAPDSSYSGAADTTERFKAQLFGRLVSEGVFRQVLQLGEPADYRMDVLIDHTRKVSPVARIMLGVFAGANSLSASVTLYNQATNTVVTAFDVQGESASHPFSTEAGLDDAVREATGKIIAGLR